MKRRKKSVRKTAALVSSRLMWPLLLLVALVGVIIVLEVTNTTHIFHKQTKSSDATGAGTVDKTSETSTNSSKGQADKTSSSSVNPSSTANSSSPPQTPYGEFVSSHKLGSNDQEQSVCSSTPGASCVISFNSNDTTRSLPSKVVDDSGNVYWTWSPQQIGLTAGSWKITATASLNNQTASSVDQIQLEVK